MLAPVLVLGSVVYQACAGSEESGADVIRRDATTAADSSRGDTGRDTGNDGYDVNLDDIPRSGL